MAEPPMLQKTPDQVPLYRPWSFCLPQVRLSQIPPPKGHPCPQTQPFTFHPRVPLVTLHLAHHRATTGLWVCLLGAGKGGGKIELDHGILTATLSQVLFCSQFYNEAEALKSSSLLKVPQRVLGCLGRLCAMPGVSWAPSGQLSVIRGMNE